MKRTIRTEERICASVYLFVFIRNLLVHLAEKILLMRPITIGGLPRLTLSSGHGAGLSGIVVLRSLPG